MADRVLVMHEGRITGELEPRGGRRGVRRARRHGPGGGGMSADARPGARAGRRRPPPRAGRPRRLTEFIFRIRELGIVIALVLLILVTGILEPRFLEADSLRNLALNASIFAILAAGQTLVIVTRNVDLSVGSVLGLSAFMAGDVLSSHPGLPWPLVFVLGMALGAALRAAQRRAGDVRPGPRARGHARHPLRLSAASPSCGPAAARSTPRRCPTPSWAWARTRSSASRSSCSSRSSSCSWWASGCATSAPGRELYAIGSNPEGARLAGVRSDRRVLTAFVLAGALAGLGGVLFTARFGTVDATAGTGYELDGRSPPPWSAAWPSSAARAASTAPRSARCCWGRSPRR